MSSPKCTTESLRRPIIEHRRTDADVHFLPEENDCLPSCWPDERDRVTTEERSRKTNTLENSGLFD